MSNEAGTVGARRPAVTGAVLVIAAGLAVGGCSSGSGSPGALACPSKPGTAVTGTAQAATCGQRRAGRSRAPTWPTPVTWPARSSPRTSRARGAWTVPLTTSTAHTAAAYAMTLVIVNGVMFVQELESNVMAISLATGKVLWTHDYNSPNAGGTRHVAGGVMYAATNHAAVALTPRPERNRGAGR